MRYRRQPSLTVLIAAALALAVAMVVMPVQASPTVQPLVIHDRAGPGPVINPTEGYQVHQTNQNPTGDTLKLPKHIVERPDPIPRK